MAEPEPLQAEGVTQSEEGAMQLAQRILVATGYVCPELQAEPSEHGWKLFAGDDVGAVRIMVTYAPHFLVEFETLMMWWRGSDSPLSHLRDWLNGQPELPPGGHLLWTQVLKARSSDELEAMLASAAAMREAMLSKAEKRGLQPVTCQLYQYYGNRLSGAGETRDGLRWRAEVRPGKVRSLWDSAPLLARAQRPFRRVK